MWGQPPKPALSGVEGAVRRPKLEGLLLMPLTFGQPPTRARHEFPLTD